jgi:hypothetical protein
MMRVPADRLTSRICPNADQGRGLLFNAERCHAYPTRRETMKLGTFDWPSIREGGLRALLCGVFVASAYLASTMAAKTQVQTGHFARECALKEITVITLIEDHGAADDLPADRLYSAALMQQRARAACYEGRIDEALVLYDSILALWPIASAKR